MKDHIIVGFGRWGKVIFDRYKKKLFNNICDAQKTNIKIF